MGEGTRATGKPTRAPRATGPDEARGTTRGHEARPRGTPPATATRRGQVPSNNGHRMPQTREARTTHDKPRHGRWCHNKLGPHARKPHPQPVGSRPRPHASKTGGRAWESAEPQTPHTKARDAPRSCCPRSAQNQLATARAVGLVTGTHAHSPLTCNQCAAGPGRTPEGRTIGRG